MRLETVILSNLIQNDEYCRKVIPYIDKTYFSDRKEAVISSIISKFFETYNKPISHDILDIEIANYQGLSDKEVPEITAYARSLTSSEGNMDWLIENTEKFCKDRAVYNAILNSIKIIDGKDSKLNPDAIPDILSKALSISFDSHVGHDYLEDASSRYDYYNRVEERVEFNLDMFNKITKNGLPKKTLNIALAGCVHPDTKVKIRIMFLEIETEISNIQGLLDLGYEIEVDSPDGYVPVSLFVDKGDWDEYQLKIISDGRIVRVNENHLFETIDGWVYAKDLVGRTDVVFLCNDGQQAGIVTKTGNRIPIVDIQVDHENHRYYTNGVSSHNTGVGKSLFMCHVAAGNLLAGRNVLYITMEMAEERIAERIDANILNVPIDQLGSMSKDVFMSRIGKITNKTKGKLIVKEYPTSSAHAGHFRALLEELKIKRNFKPDIVMIDYLNICTSQRVKMSGSVNSYTYVKAIAEELRGLAVEYDVPILSATQTTRSGFTNSDPGLEDTSESFGLPATADFMFALVSSEELESMNQIMVKQLKNRYSSIDYYKRFVIGIDRSKMTLYDVEESAQSLSGAGKVDNTVPWEGDSSAFSKSDIGVGKRATGFSDFKF